MTELDETSGLLWQASEHELHGTLSGDARFDVAVVGAGIAGLGLAHKLSGSGLTVGLFEAARAGHQATGRSTAKLTSQHALRYDGLISDIGEDGARLYGQANEDALAWVRDIAGNAPWFQPAEAVVFAGKAGDTDAVRKEAEAAARLGLPARFEARLDISVKNHGAVVFSDQAQIDPLALADLLVSRLPDNVTLHERTRIRSIEHGAPCVLKTDAHQIKADKVVVATQMPIIQQGLFYAKNYPHAHVVVAAKAGTAKLPEGMYITAGTPKRSFRQYRLNGASYVVATGDSCKPGDTKALQAILKDLRGFLKKAFGIEGIDHVWTNEDFKPMDGLPFIGAATPRTPNLMVATGFDAWGLTTGIVAADILAARITGEQHLLEPCLAASRLRPLKGGATFVKENAVTAINLARERLLPRRLGKLASIVPGEGAVIEHKGEKVAVSRNTGGEIIAVSAICTHMGCVLGWNPLSKTWDCPCHGSRFSRSGAVQAGPAVEPLKTVALDEAAEGGGRQN